MNNRQTTVLIHVATWAALLLVPMMSMGHSDGLTPRHVLISVGVTLSFIAVFYPNFLWITPRYYTHGQHHLYVLFNLVVIIVIAMLFHCWMSVCNTAYPSQRHPHENTFHWAFIVRNMFNLSIVAAIATAMQLAARWRMTEEARIEAEAARVDAELKTLRNQINPHFLLNTLNNIYALTAFNTTKAQEAIQQLSKMLRHLLYDYEQPTVPVRDEEEFLENYISLMRIRLPQSVDVSFTTQLQQLSSIEVAPMIFISLVENAFKHGISPTEPSFIHIHLTADEHEICCDIQNSNHPKSATDHSGHGIGLKQVQRRLDLAYPNRYTWQHGVTEDGKIYQSKITIKL